MSRTKTIALIISHLTSAPIFAIYISLLIIICEPTLFSPFNPLDALFLTIIFLTILPPLPIPIATLLGHTDFFVTKQDKRPAFFAFAVIMHFLGAMITYLMNSPLLALYILCYGTVTLSLMIVNFKTKISVHVAGITGPITYVVYFLGIPFIMLYLIAIPVAWARYILKAHTLQQLLLGAFDAIVVTIVTCALWVLFVL
ncbi:MAG: hypothetical protein ACP6IS_01685 [Candidatus Asgardarchaeia archaeon]